MIAIGKVGIWFAHNAMSIAESVAFAQKVEACGYGALWIPEAIGREPFVHLASLASQTSTLVLATGIANIWARDAVTMAAAQKTLVEISGNRFLLGLGGGFLLGLGGGLLMSFGGGLLLGLGGGFLLSLSDGFLLGFGSGLLLGCGIGFLLGFGGSLLLRLGSGFLLGFGSGLLLSFGRGFLLSLGRGFLLGCGIGFLLSLGRGLLLGFRGGLLSGFGGCFLLGFGSGLLLSFGRRLPTRLGFGFLLGCLLGPLPLCLRFGRLVATVGLLIAKRRWRRGGLCREHQIPTRCQDEDRHHHADIQLDAVLAGNGQHLRWFATGRWRRQRGCRMRYRLGRLRCRYGRLRRSAGFHAPDDGRVAIRYIRRR